MANDDGNWAPRWKGTVAIGWARGPWTANIDGRYLGRYRDYDPLANGSYAELGKFWYYDANVRYALGSRFAPADRWLRGTYLSIGGVNLFNKLPEFSNYQNGSRGYDLAQADILGRSLYLSVGTKW